LALRLRASASCSRADLVAGTTGTSRRVELPKLVGISSNAGAVDIIRSLFA